MVRKYLCAGAAVAALMMGSAAQASASEIVADPSTVSTSSGAGSQVRTAAIQGDVRTSGTQGLIRSNVKAVPGTRAQPMPTPNTCDGELNYTCDD